MLYKNYNIIGHGKRGIALSLPHQPTQLYNGYLALKLGWKPTMYTDLYLWSKRDLRCPLASPQARVYYTLLPQVVDIVTTPASTWLGFRSFSSAGLRSLSTTQGPGYSRGVWFCKGRSVLLFSLFACVCEKIDYQYTCSFYKYWRFYLIYFVIAIIINILHCCIVSTGVLTAKEETNMCRIKSMMICQ